MNRRRESFDDVAELYDQARPAYPPRLIDDLIEVTALGPDQRVLEIGPGTGQLTLPLANLGVSLIAVELGSRLADVTRRKLSRFKQAEVVVADFDQWRLPDTRFDLVVVGTAFHWLNPATRIQKCVDALRPGGTLAIIETHWGIAAGADPFFVASQSCYARWDPEHDSAFRAPRPEDLPEERGDLEESQLFEQIIHRRYLCHRAYSASQYCALLGTFSNILTLDKPSRTGFLACIGDMILTQFGGRIVRHDLYDLWLARTCDTSYDVTESLSC